MHPCISHFAPGAATSSTHAVSAANVHAECLPRHSTRSAGSTRHSNHASAERHEHLSSLDRRESKSASAMIMPATCRRHVLGVAAAAAVSALMPGGSQAAIIDEQIAEAVFDQASASVASIILYRTVGDSQIEEGVGSGLVWDRLGHIVTNYHCISPVKLDKNGNQRISVVFGEGTPARQAFDASITGSDAQYDLAVLHIDAPAELLQPIRVGTSADLKVGASAYAIGNPAGLTKTMSTGVISGLNRSIPTPAGTMVYGVIQTDASINAGSSGGALLDSFGRLVGVSTATFTRSGTGRGSGVNFALPIDLVRTVVPSLIVYGTSGNRGTRGAGAAQPAPAAAPGMRDRHCTNTARSVPGTCGVASKQRRHALHSVAAAAPLADLYSAESRSAGAPSTSQTSSSGDDWRQVVLEAAADTGSQLIRASMRGRPSETMPYRSATIRPVMVKGRRVLQVSCLTAKQDLTSNYATAAAADAAMEALLALPWHSASIQTLHGSASIQITKKGRAIISRSSAATAGPSGGTTPLLHLAHDRAKGLPIAEQPDAFLQAIGLQSADGRIKASMRAKYAQINEFLKLLIHTGQLDGVQREGRSSSTSSGGSYNQAHPLSTMEHGSQEQHTSVTDSPRAPIHIIDCGCGSAHLTFGAYHYINNILGQPVVLTGVDANAGLMARSNEQAAALGLADARFHACSIKEFTPEVKPDIVLALHACDTATDEALALGVHSDASVIMSVPCCHKTLHQQLATRAPAPLGPMLRHGILRQRTLDMVTDSLRAQLLRLAGYRTDIVEFISTEHTQRNLLLRAVRQQQRPTEAQLGVLVSEYTAMREYWGGAPALEDMLAPLLPHAIHNQ